ncbi:MAG: hypothetical protein EXS63_04385 [Candidatus Omnitrophica bacterium]|nr:hypothetical protein [Candidatus Omnitrophota bacterium]
MTLSHEVRMKKYSIVGMMVLSLALGSWGCKTVEKIISPAHSEVLIYNLSFDLTYLRTLEALQTVPDWELRLTEKEKGKILVYNLAFGKFGDSDKRSITFLLSRISRTQTSVRIDPDDQHVPGGGALMERVASFLNQEY